MKIFFSMSIAALLGFATVGSSVQAQSSPQRFWNDSKLAAHHNGEPAEVAQTYPPYPNQDQAVADGQTPPTPGAPCPQSGSVLLDTPQQYHAGVQPQSSVPYFYGGGAVSSQTVPCASGDCSANPYESAMRGPWSGQSKMRGKLSGLFSKKSSCDDGGCDDGGLFGGKSCGSFGSKLGGMFSRGGSDCGTSGYAVGGRSLLSGRGNACGTGSQWFGGANGLIFFRDKADEVFLTYPAGDPRNRVLTTRSVDGDTLGGVEATVGRHLNNGWSVAGTYWGLFGAQDTNCYSGSPYTYLTGLSNLNYNASDVLTYYNNRATHHVRMQNEFHSAELNLIRRFCATPINSCCGRGTRIDLIAGPRYFNFNDDFQFYGVADSANPGADVNDMYYNIDTDNHLYGFQMGGAANYCVTERLSMRAGSKVGIYGNHIEHRQRIYGSLGNATINTGSYAGQEYDFDSSKDDVAFLGEIDLGMQYAMTANWSANAGYRAVFVNGVAHTTDQIPSSYTAVPGILQVNSNGSLILHGIYAGATFNY